MEVPSAPPPRARPLPAHIKPRRPGLIKMGQDMKETEATSLLDKVNELGYKIKKMMEEKNELLNGRTKTDQMEDHHPSKDFVIAFVESLEKANQYYDFQKFLIQDINILHDSHRDLIFDSIVTSQVRKEKFEKVDDEVIQSAIDMRLFIAQQMQEVRSRYAFRKRLIECDTITLRSSFVEDIEAVGSFELYPCLNYEELEVEIMKYKLHFNLSPRSQNGRVTKKIYMEKNEKEFKRDLAIFEQEKDGYADAYTTYNIIFRSRRGQYVMDQDPRAELEKLMKLHPLLYGFLNLEVSKMMLFDQESLVGYDQEKTVAVWGISNGASWQDVWEKFSVCGEIVGLHMRRVNNRRVAYVTFRDLNGLQEALELVRPKIRGWEVRVEVADSSLPSSEIEVRSKYLFEGDEAASGVEIVEVAGSSPPPPETEEYSEYLSEGDEAASGVEIIEVFDSSMFEKALKKYSELIKRHEIINRAQRRRQRHKERNYRV